MAIGETAQLAVNLTLGGNFNAGLSQAESSLSRFGAAATGSTARTGILSGAFASVGVAAGKVGGALSHAGNQIKNLVTGPLGIIGLTGGLLSFGGAIGATLGKMNDLAFSTEKLTALTGESAQTLSTLIAGTAKYGIGIDQLTTIAGFYEKTVGKLSDSTAKQATATKSAALQNLELQKTELEATGASTKHIDALIKQQTAYDKLHPSIDATTSGLTKLQALEKQFGVTLTDATGKALPFGQALLTVADVYQKSTDKAQAAYLASQLFGRGYAALIPVLALGRQGIIDMEAEAAKMGLQLSDQNVADFAKYRTAIRDSQEAISGLEVAIGLQLLPEIVKLANGLTEFVTTHKSDIVNFVKGAEGAAESAATAIGAVVGGVQAAWNMIPPELRGLLLGAIAGDRVVHFLFGFSPIGSLFGGIEKIIGSAVAGGVAKGAISAGLGKLFVQPVFVTNPGFGNLAGAAEGAAGAAGTAEGAAAGAGGMGLLASTAAVAAVGALALGGAAIIGGVAHGLGFKEGTQDTGYHGFMSSSQFNTLNQTIANNGLMGANAREDRVANAIATPGFGGVDLEPALYDTASAVRGLSSVMQKADWLRKLEDSWKRAGASFQERIQAAIKGLSGPHADAAAAFLGANVGSHGPGAGGHGQAEQVIELLKGMRQTPEVVTAIHRLEAKLPRLAIDHIDLAKAMAIAQSNDPKNRKLDELNAIMADLRAHGDRTTRAKVQDLINAVKHQKPPIINVTVPVVVRTNYYGAGSTVSKSVVTHATAGARI
jgi:hypothetical protein